MTIEREVRCTVHAGARKERFAWCTDTRDACVAYVREPAQRGLANARVRALVAAHCGVPVACVRILTGHRSPKKRLRIIMKT